jgi:hypothetical protein
MSVRELPDNLKHSGLHSKTGRQQRKRDGGLYLLLNREIALFRDVCSLSGLPYSMLRANLYFDAAFTSSLTSSRSRLRR